MDENGIEYVQPDDDAAFSRRALIGGIGAAGAVGLAFGVDGVTVVQAAAADRPDAIDPPTPGLVYLPLDAFAFDVADTAPTLYRLYQELTGMQPSAPARDIYASLPIPIGSVVAKINVAYIGQPVIAITRRVFGTQEIVDAMTPVSLPASSASPGTTTVSVNVALTPGATYAVRAFCSAGQSILGMEIGYIPAAQAFVPYAGTSPRALDSRDTTKFAANEERTVDLSSRLIPTARAAVINVTAVDTAGPGFLAAFADGIPYPGNSSVN
jgi:hypothetical protein